MADPVYVGPDLIVNGDFELGLASWTEYGASVETGIVHGGSQSCAITGTLASIAQIVAAESGVHYRVTASIYRTTGDGYVYIFAYWRDSAGNLLQISDTWTMPRSTPLTSRPGEHVGYWSTHSAVISATHEDLAQIRLVVVVTDGTETVYVDDISVAEVRYADAPDWVYPDDMIVDGHPSRYGMRVEAYEYRDTRHVITTTGCVWYIDTDEGHITATQRIGTERHVISALLTGLEGPWTLSTRNDDVLVLRSDTCAIAWHGDGVMMIAPNVPITMRILSRIAAGHWVLSAGHHMTAVDLEGGWSAMPYARPEMGTDGTTSELGTAPVASADWEITYSIAAREMLGISIFPPRAYREEDSYRRRIVMTLAPPTAEAIADYARYATVLGVFAGIYQDHDAGETHAPYTALDAVALQSCVDAAHAAGMEIILYRHPTSYAWADIDYDTMITDMVAWRAEYGHDGWYLDGAPSWDDWYVAWGLMRRLRDDVGDGMIYLHATVGPPHTSVTQYCPCVDTYADVILRGEGQEILGPDDTYMDYVIDTRPTSNAICTLKYDAMAVSDTDPTLATNRQVYEWMLERDARARWAYPSYPFGADASDDYRGYYVRALDRMETEWRESRACAQGVQSAVSVPHDVTTPDVPLGASRWLVYYDADYDVRTTDGAVTAWYPIVGDYPLTAVGSPVVGVIGARDAITLAKASTQYLHVDSIAHLLAEDHVIAMHVCVDTTTSADTLVSIGSSSDALRYYWWRVASAGNAIVAAGRGSGDALTTGDQTHLITDAREYTIVMVRRDDEYDIWIDGRLSVIGGSLVLASMGALDRMTIGALRRNTVSYPADLRIRRLAIMAGDTFTRADAAALDAAWRGL